MLANFPYHNEGEHIERQFRIWYAVAVGVLFGVVSLLLALLINRHQSKLGWQVYTALVLVSVVKQGFLKAQTPQPPLNEVALTDEIPELEM